MQAMNLSSTDGAGLTVSSQAKLKGTAGGMQSCNWKMHSLQKFASIHASFQRLLSKRSTLSLTATLLLQSRLCFRLMTPRSSGL